MKARASVIMLAAAVIGIIIGWFGRGIHKSTDSRAASTDGVPEDGVARPFAPQSQLPANLQSSPAETVLDSDQFLDLERAREDPKYNNTVVRRHVSINGYLNSPIKGSHQLEGLLELLLANGYSIDDLMMAYVKLHMCCGETENSESRMLNTARVRSNSLSNPLSDQELLFGMKRDCVTWTFYAHDNPEFVKQLIATVPEAAPPPGPAHEFLPVIPPRQGERLLKDEDWMTDRHRQIIAAYHGPPRSLYPEEDRRLRAAAPAR